MGQQGREIHRPDRGPGGEPVNPGHLQQLGVGGGDALADVLPAEGQHHQKGDEHRKAAAADPHQGQDDEGGHRGGLHRRHGRGEEFLHRPPAGRGGGQRPAQRQTQEKAQGHPPQGVEGGAPEDPGEQQPPHPQEHRPRGGEEQGLVHSQRGPLPEEEPEAGDPELFQGGFSLTGYSRGCHRGVSLLQTGGRPRRAPKGSRRRRPSSPGR